MEIKYEPVFGDQALFDDADPDVVLVETNGVYRTFHKESDSRPYNIASVSRSDLAMRRIIRTPTWTVADQKEGKLPEVGCRVSFCYKLNTNWRTGEIKYIDDQVTVIKTDDIDRPFVYEVDRVEFKPIESPEEKAARLRGEWVDTARFMTAYEIYDKLLSGELKMPEVE